MLLNRNQTSKINMKISQLRVLPFSVALIIISSCLSSTAAPWSEKDGMKLMVPKRMARLLQKLTKHQDSTEQDVPDIKTTIKLMHLNGLRNRDDTEEADESMKKQGDSSLPRRSKRSVRKNKLPHTCHSGKVYVNLTQYNNIMAPQGFHTHYCGSTYLLPIGNDPIVQTISQAILDTYNSMKKFSPKVLANPSCCAPKKFHDLYVLYMDQGQFTTIRTIPKVKASRCACKND